METLEKLLRIVTIVILLAIAISIIYFKFGYVDPDDSAVYREGELIINCKDAMLYYLDKELHINESTRIEQKVELYLDLGNSSEQYYRDSGNYSGEFIRLNSPIP